jgi:hypothetical protein
MVAPLLPLAEITLRVLENFGQECRLQKETYSGTSILMFRVILFTSYLKICQGGIFCV